MNIGGWIEGWARQRPRSLAVHFEGRDADYQALSLDVARAAGALAALGLERGDRVALLAHNRPEYLHIAFACARLGLTLVPLNWRLAPAEHAYMLEHADARALITEPGLLESAAQSARTVSRRAVLGEDEHEDWSAFEGLCSGSSPIEDGPGSLDDAFLLVYTSGTTGRPKGAVLTQSAVQWNAVNAAHAHDLTSADQVLTNLPLFHVGGLNIQTLPALHAGGAVTLHRRFDPGLTLRDIRARRPTHYLMVPATMDALINHPEWTATDLSSLRLAMAGSAPIPRPLIEAFHARGIPVGQIYGSTETAPIATYLRAEDAGTHIGSCGKAAVHCEVRIAGESGAELPAGESGEILVRGPSILSGYWRDPAATSAAIVDGWFHTGDVGHMDGDGFCYVDDRKNDVIISGGENVYPAEVENVLAEREDLAEYAVVGRPHPRWGEVPVAFVVAKTDTAVEQADILAAFDGRLAHYKHPREVIVTDALPRNAMGKVLKYRLRERLRGPAEPA